MSAKAELKHTAALGAVAIGGLAVIVAAVTAFVAFDKGAPGWFGCTAVSGLLGLFQVRRGLKLREQAVAEGASVPDFESDDTGHTTRTEAKKPSFLERSRKPEPDGDEHEVG